MRSKFIFQHVDNQFFSQFYEKQHLKMLVVFQSIFVANTKIIFGYNLLIGLTRGFRIANSMGHCLCSTIPTGIYLLKVNNGNTRTRCEKCSKLTINFEHISHLVLVFLLLTLSRKMPAGITFTIDTIFTVFIVFFEIF